MKIKKETDILNINVRSNIIEEIKDDENEKRKANAKKRYDIFKDGSKKYVLEQLEKELDKETVEEMKSRTPNLSFLRWIIDKKARVFKDGVRYEVSLETKKPGLLKRLVGQSSEAQTQKVQSQVDAILDYINIGTIAKKVNKFSELFKNTAGYAVPIQDFVTSKWKYKVKVLQPYLYDAIEDEQDPEEALVFIFSYYNQDAAQTGDGPGKDGKRIVSNTNRSGDGIDQTIADSPDDFGSDEERFVWWTKNYHFTTNGKGEYVNDGDTAKIDNEIKMHTLTNFPQEQDGQFWAIGGDDLIDGSVTLNQLLADLFFIAKVQGMGQFYFFGKGVPKSMKVGPNRALTHEVKDRDEPEPKAGFLTSNPPLLEHMELVEKFLFMLLTTNELEAGSIDMSGREASSGVHEVVKKSSNVADIQDQREMYSDNMPKLIMSVIKWHNILFDKKMLIPELEAIGRIPEEIVINSKYMDAPEFQSEKEKLEVIEKRRELGLDSVIDSIMRDNPDMDRDEAEKKYATILADQVKYSRAKLLGLTMDEEPENDEKPEEVEEKEEI